MVEQNFIDSNFRFTDPIRFFKANDPYYFEVDNIPLKQLQENCLWLKDQLRDSLKTKLVGVKRSDIDELRPYATGGDRTLRVKPGRYTARINDASSKNPLAYLSKVMGTAIGDVDAWAAALPNPGNFPDGKNAILQAALDTFKQSVAQDAMGMTGLVERAFTWPVVNSDTPIDNDGVDLAGMAYGDSTINIPGGSASYSPMVISQALLWAKSQGATTDTLVLPSFETTNTNDGWAKFPKTESYFIKRWRGVSRLAVVDVDDEISVEVPQFDPTDFSYVGSDGRDVTVQGVESRIDLVFIYSKPVDSSGVTILKPSGQTTITKPSLGIVRGAGIKANFQESTNVTQDYLTNLADDHGILAHPGDQKNELLGFTSTSSNELLEDIRGSFPAPDDLLNLAPLISEQLEDNAIELVGQSILPVAYVWVQNGSQVVLSSDVIDIRPLFRTAELTYNERAGLGAAFPQLSLANPAVGKSQLDYELKRTYDTLDSRIENLESVDPGESIGVLATGYVFGGWNFGPEGAMYEFYQKAFASDGDPNTNDDAYIKQYINSKYGFGGAGGQVSVPSYPDWDLSEWCTIQSLQDKGLFPNDYLNTFVDAAATGSEPSIVGGSYNSVVYADGTTTGGGTPTRVNQLINFNIGAKPSGSLESRCNFNYISKKIKFVRPANLIDYKVDVSFVNCVGENYRGWASFAQPDGTPGSYVGTWVEKGFDEFTIYTSFVGDSNNFDKTYAPFPPPRNTGGVSYSGRADMRWNSFAVMVSDLLYSNTAPIHADFANGYSGNPRLGVCTYPTIMWTFTGIPSEDSAYLYGNLNGTDPVITLKS